MKVKIVDKLESSSLKKFEHIKKKSDNEVSMQELSFPDEEVIIIQSLENNKDTCLGDSGSPVYTLNEQDGKYTLIGIASFGVGNCDPDSPIGLTRISGEVLQWVRSIAPRQCNRMVSPSMGTKSLLHGALGIIPFF